ncbi:MAG: 30S ribosomal protein S11 [Candidatus Moranbacteria bacterium CG_4_8_14_3_um_filter_34_16]|nr:MAG: 30S ribosomal protein S11 [Candidatus Moranbacteria bacterium CG08_land_8_20_14_0_20_34_16]PIW94658.1 MAG: 30S ribosomal protein S11 [Candidatus Moranbacteria bacterium CG_4_8_14_3_um_filter_34_16]PJA89302.1 MAG: 30S ribosomal protein S11 [Candidatus Moranbacteria bacterium CG_4_9_14_3_um_filter_33_15]
MNTKEKSLKKTEKEKTTEKVEVLKVEKKTLTEKNENGSNDSKEISLEKKKVKKIRKQILKGRATIKCSYNNTLVSISDLNGNVLGWASSGLLGFKGAKKATPYAATQVVANVSEKVKKYGVKELEVFVKGVGSGREASIRTLAGNGFDLSLIKDITPIPHNGCRPKKPRRI